MPATGKAPPGVAVPTIQQGDFDRVDATDAPTDFVRWMQHQRTQVDPSTLDALHLDAAQAVLDIGCGPGADLRLMAPRVPLAVGVDRSATMASAARAHAETATLALADARALPFADRSFDACWARAVLVHSPAPEDVVGEIARVLAPGGRAVLSEPDQGSHIVSSPLTDVFERVKRHRQSTFRSPFVGRNLAGLAVGAGLVVAGGRVTRIAHTSLESARAAGGPFDRAVDAAVADGAVTRSEGDAYLASLVEADAHGAFLFAALSVAVAVSRPAEK